MGRSGSSSKRKSSTKKSIKKSSEARRKKRTRRSKSKKLRRHDDSVSSYSDDESTRSSLASSSSSEGEYESRRAGSRARYEVKHSRKRTRRRSPSEESNKDALPRKKRKRSKKKDDPEARKKKKKNKKKNSRRDAYVSLSGSDSSSCSTCRGGDSSSSEGEELERLRGRPRERKQDHKDSIKGRNERRSNRSRHRSPSSSKLSNSYSDESNEKLVVENNPRRLKSVITVAIRPEEEDGTNINKDELKEEIVYDYDDYPSCRSNDSNDGGNKNDHLDVSSQKRMLESVIGEAVSASSPKDMKSVSTAMNASKENVDSKQKETSTSGKNGSEESNLELILRQKALENLSRFRGRLQTKARVPVDDKRKSDQSGVEQLPTAKVNLVQSQGQLTAHKQDDSTMSTQPVIEKRRFTWTRDTPVATVKEEKAATYGKIDSSKSQAPAPKLECADPSSTSRVVNKSVDVTSKTNDAHKSITIETPPCDSNEEGGSKEQQTETKDSSQFEQKTMSVMRGGEMVQVSYKVYIPKKAPALARRQLKR